jgi:hypothetical protein
MSGQNKKVPIQRKDFASEFKTLESFENSLRPLSKKPFKVFPDNPAKREEFRSAFEAQEAVRYRDEVMALHGTKHWQTVDEFEDLARIAAEQRESGREALAGILALTENDIKNAREELGGRFASMIQQKQFKELDAILKAIQKAPTQRKRPAEIYLAIFDYIKMKEQLPTAEMLRSFYNDQKRRTPRDPEPDPSNFSKVLLKLGFSSLPKHHL